MKYLKYFEGVENTQMGITREEVNECFYDLSDDGWTINAIFDKKLKTSSIPNLIHGISRLDLIPYLEIRIFKMLMKIDQNYQKLMDSDNYKECLGKLKDRLLENDLFIKEEKIERIQGGGSRIKILIYRKSDEKLC